MTAVIRNTVSPAYSAVTAESGHPDRRGDSGMLAVCILTTRWND